MDDLKRVEDIIKLITNSLTKEDFIKAFSQVIKLVQDLKKTNEKEFSLIHQAVQTFQNKLNSDTSMTLSDMKGKVNEIISDKFVKMFAEHKKEMYLEMEMEMDKMHQEIGQMPKKDEIISETLTKLPEQKAEEIRNKLETLKGENRLDKSAIRGLEEEIKQLKEEIMKRPLGGGGGKKITSVRSENLSSQCNGVLKSFTMPSGTLKVLGVWSSQFPITFNEGVDWTFSGRTLTLTSAVSAPATGQTLFALIENAFYSK